MSNELPQPKERNLFFTSDVNLETIGRISQQIIDINANDAHLALIYAAYGQTYVPAPIKVYIDSYGGYAYQCMGLLGIIENSKTPIHTIVTGCAMSCGFLIAITGHKRFCYSKSTLLYHQVSSGYHGKLKELQEDLTETKRLQKIIEQHTLDHTGITKERLKKAFDGKEDWFISAKQALKLKCIDEII